MNEIRRKIHKWNDSLIERNHKKETNSEAREYNEWGEKWSKKHQYQTWSSRRKKMWSQREVIWKYLVRGKQRKNDWKKRENGINYGIV